MDLLTNISLIEDLKPKQELRLAVNNVIKNKKLMKAFGGLKAINKVDFELPANEIRGIIGPNGSGKSTFLT